MIYTLTRSKRKTVAITIRDGNIEVRAPNRMPKRDIEKFITEKEKWILKNINLQRQRANQRVSFSLNYGDSVICRGTPRVITAKSGDYVSYDDECFFIPADLTPDEIKYACVQIYKIIAKLVLLEKTYEFAKLYPVKPATVKVNSAKARWGSCSANRNINYSWRLIMADDDVIDYVVVHELSHMMELNHGDYFWKIVEEVLPDYRERKIRLKELQRRLSTEEWE